MKAQGAQSLTGERIVREYYQRLHQILKGIRRSRRREDDGKVFGSLSSKGESVADLVPVFWLDDLEETPAGCLYRSRESNFGAEQESKRLETETSVSVSGCEVTSARKLPFSAVLEV